jgi:flagellar motility protein MotE (MotC chaperone)
MRHGNGPSPVLVGVLTSCGLALLMGILLALNSLETPRSAKEPQKPATRRKAPPAVVEPQPVPAMPAKPNREQAIADARELKEVQHAIETIKERLSVIRKISAIRAENAPGGNPALVKGSPELYRAVEGQQRNEQDREEIARLNERLSALMAREAELEASTGD